MAPEHDAFRWNRHREERSDVAIQSHRRSPSSLDRFPPGSLTRGSRQRGWFERDRRSWRPHEANVGMIDSRSSRRPHRAGHFPQRRERLLRAPGEGARTPRSGDRGRPRRHHLGRRVDYRIRRMDQRSRTISARASSTRSSPRRHDGRWTSSLTKDWPAGGPRRSRRPGTRRRSRRLRPAFSGPAPRRRSSE